jgi:hypothetical protein
MVAIPLPKSLLSSTDPAVCFAKGRGLSICTFHHCVFPFVFSFGQPLFFLRSLRGRSSALFQADTFPLLFPPIFYISLPVLHPPRSEPILVSRVFRIFTPIHHFYLSSYRHFLLDSFLRSSFYLSSSPPSHADHLFQIYMASSIRRPKCGCDFSMPPLWKTTTQTS